MASETTGTPVDNRALIVRDVDVDYHIYSDSRPATVRRFVVGRFREREHRVINAVRGVSLEIKEGEAVGLIGRNGSGKTTLLRTIGGLLPTARGAIWAASIPVILGVRGAVHPELSGRRNVFLAGTALGIPKATLDERFDEIVGFADLWEFIDLPLRAYSSGMAARLQFSVASCVRPDILCIDEALAVGDEEFKKKSNARVRELTDGAGVVVLVSHNLNAVREICTRAVWLDKGRVLADGPVDEVCDQYLRETAGSEGA